MESILIHIYKIPAGLQGLYGSFVLLSQLKFTQYNFFNSNFNLLKIRLQSFMSEFNCSYFGVLLLTEMKEILHTATTNLPTMASHLCTTNSHKIQKMRTYHNSYTGKDVQKTNPKVPSVFLGTTQWFKRYYSKCTETSD